MVWNCGYTSALLTESGLFMRSIDSENLDSTAIEMTGVLWAHVVALANSYKHVTIWCDNTTAVAIANGQCKPSVKFPVLDKMLPSWVFADCLSKMVPTFHRTCHETLLALFSALFSFSRHLALLA